MTQTTSHTVTATDRDLHSAITNLVASDAIAENEVLPLLCALLGLNPYERHYGSGFPKKTKWPDGAQALADKLDRIKDAYANFEAAVRELEAARANLAGYNFQAEVPLFED